MVQTNIKKIQDSILMELAHWLYGHYSQKKSSNFKNPRWWMVPILKNKKSQYLHNRLTDFD